MSTSDGVERITFRLLTLSLLQLGESTRLQSAISKKQSYVFTESKKLNPALNNERTSSSLIKYNSLYVCKSQKKTNHRYLAITERCNRELMAISIPSKSFSFGV